MVKWKKLTR